MKKQLMGQWSIVNGILGVCVATGAAATSPAAFNNTDKVTRPLFQGHCHIHKKLATNFASRRFDGTSTVSVCAHSVCARAGLLYNWYNWRCFTYT